LSPMDRVLVVDDDVELCGLIREYLEPQGFDVEVVHDGEAGLARAQTGDPNIVVLDIMMPKMNGLDMLRQLRTTSPIPVLLLTARGSDVDRILGLELGADDYLPKPFNARELSARLRAILRRMGAVPQNQPRVKVGDVELDFTRRTVTRSGHSIELTAVEFNMLACLMKAAGRVVTRDELSKEVLGRIPSPFDRSIDVHVSKVRKKLSTEIGLGDPIKTVRGVGYIYTLPGEDASE
jgi:DNA-binding response OmpR family regulator